MSKNRINIELNFILKLKHYKGRWAGVMPQPNKKKGEINLMETNKK